MSGQGYLWHMAQSLATATGDDLDMVRAEWSARAKLLDWRTLGNIVEQATGNHHPGVVELARIAHEAAVQEMKEKVMVDMTGRGEAV